MRKFGIILLLALVSFPASAQEKVYTRKMKLSDFPQTTTRVVLGRDAASSALQEQISRRWTYSPFEFCSPESYETYKNSINYYFIRLDRKDGFTFLVLSKGGDENDTDPLNRGFEIISFPIAPSEGPFEEASLFMAGYVDILQTFIADAIQSDRTAYLGLKAYFKATGRKPILSGKEATAAFDREQEGYIADIVVTPSLPDRKSDVWHYLIDTGPQHRLYRTFRTKWKKH